MCYIIYTSRVRIDDLLNLFVTGWPDITCLSKFFFSIWIKINPTWHIATLYYIILFSSFLVFSTNDMMLCFMLSDIDFIRQAPKLFSSLLQNIFRMNLRHFKVETLKQQSLIHDVIQNCHALSMYFISPYDMSFS